MKIVPEPASLEKVFIFYGTRRFTHCDLGGLALSLREDLHRQRILPNQIVGIHAAPSLQSVAAICALWSLGATVWICPLREPLARIEEMAKSLQARTILRPDARFVPPSRSSRTDAFYKEMQHDAAKTLLNTSGSSGTPKFVQHSLAQHYQSAVGVNERLEFDRTQSWFLSLPLYHVGGLAILIRAFAANASVVLPCAGESLSDVLQRQKVTHLSLVSTQLKRLIADPGAIDKLKKCRKVILGGGPIPAWVGDVAKELQLPLVSSYGATEMASMWTATNSNLENIAEQGSGTALASREVVIADDGEILVRGAMLLQRYYGQSERPLDEEGFYRTGDVGSIDERGNLHVLGRKDSMFITGGENVHPEEIESSLLNISNIEDAIVVSVPHSEWGERPVAFVRFHKPQAIDERKLRQQLGMTLPAFKIPDKFLDWPASEYSGLKPSRANLRLVALTAG